MQYRLKPGLEWYFNVMNAEIVVDILSDLVESFVDGNVSGLGERDLKGKLDSWTTNGLFVGVLCSCSIFIFLSAYATIM